MKILLILEVDDGFNDTDEAINLLRAAHEENEPIEVVVSNQTYTAGIEHVTTQQNRSHRT